MSTETENHYRQIIHISMYPNFNALDWKSYARVDGMRSLGFISKHRPDIHIITDRTETDFEPSDIIPEIESALASGKKVGLFFWDEDFILTNTNKEKLNLALESFTRESVYLCSNMAGECLLTYTETRKVPVKTMHVPWWYVELTININSVYDTTSYRGPNESNALQFACFNNRPARHKKSLVDALLNRGFAEISNIIYDNQQLASGKDIAGYYQDKETLNWNSSHDMKRSLIWQEDSQSWICHNSRNISRLQQLLEDIPLVISAESNLGIFPITEKSLWPIIMGRMFMIYARPRLMQYLQQYLDYDLALYLDLEFDSIDGWDEKTTMQRLECMIDKNVYTILHARDIWHQVSHEIRSSAQSLTEKFYQKFCQQLDLIT